MSEITDNVDQLPCQTSDSGAANLLAKWYGDELQYGQGVGWMTWTGCRWVHNEAAGVQCVGKMIKDMFKLAAKLEGEDRRALAEFALSCESAHRIRAIVFLAQHHPRLNVKLDCFDADPWLFNCQSGTIDLRTGEIHEHRKEDRITRISPVVYTPDARCELWEDSLRVWLPNEEEILCAQIAAGYSFTGLVDEEKFFCLFGPEASGKTTFAETVKGVAGDYATTADFETFLKKTHVNGGGARGDIARLMGSRIVTSSESNDGAEFGAGLIKNITGKEKVVARRLYKEEIEFLPTFKLWLIANHAPYIDPDDGAMWRRLVRLPFIHSIPAEKRDPSVKRRLLDVQESGPGILNWILEGVRKWRASGLVIPGSVQEAAEELRAGMDSSAEFFEDKLLFGKLYQSPASSIRQAYDAWAEVAGVSRNRRLGPKGMAKKLQGRGCEASRDAGGTRVWAGVMVC